MVSYRNIASKTKSNPFPLTTRGFNWIQEFPYNR
jgi:hypothetical protein